MPSLSRFLSSNARLPLLAACVTTAACATTATTATKQSSRAAFATETTHYDSVVVRVVNHVDRPVTVYRVGKGTRAPLGKVAAKGEGRFAMGSGDVSGRLTLAAAPVGERTSVESAPFYVQRGQMAVFVIAPSLGGSQVLVDYPTR